jgi:alkylation response protein AidB-like acyl-CoA dehydrogenase
MDFGYPAEAEAFRAEVRAWLAEHLPADLVGAPAQADRGTDALERLRDWNRALADAGYAAIAWPVEYGGRGAGILDQVVFAEEMHRAGAPGPLNPIGIANIAPAIMQWGTEEQKRRFLPPMLRGDDIWCQGFSEPNAGSDLASLQCRADIEGDQLVINGQKVWNTFGDIADWCELLVRTDRDAPKHKGISCVLVDMRLPGVEVRPLMTITGDPGFSEIFFTDVRVPVTALLGALHDGWNVAMTTLAHERGGVAQLHLGVRAKIRDLIHATREAGRLDDPMARRALARLYVEGEHMKLLADRAISAELHGRPLGPESSLMKLVWSDVENHIAEVAGEVLGPEANMGRWGRERLYVRSVSIAGGTTQVNRNIIAQRVLGLPRA